MTLVDSLRFAAGTLTVLPVGAVRHLDRRVSGKAMLVAPFAVLPLAIGAAGVGWSAHVLGSPALICGLLTVAVLALGTRALHLDGLADTVDGLGSGWDRDLALAVMRRGDVGPMGVTALILVLGAQVVATGQVLTSWQGGVQVVVLICFSRAALALLCRRGVPAARPDGLGATVAETVPGWAAAVTWVAGVGILALVWNWRAEGWWLGLLAGLAAAVGVMLLLRLCVRRFGGVTGDVMGAAVEIALTILLVSAAR
jgi:adenosylcobinamide-GDP ribazoletransferase